MKKTKINTGGSNHTITYHPEVKANFAPRIEFEYLEDGEPMYELDNGHTISAANYNKVWFPQKGKLKPITYKGPNPDKTKIPR